MKKDWVSLCVLNATDHADLCECCFKGQRWIVQLVRMYKPKSHSDNGPEIRCRPTTCETPSDI